MLFYLFHYKGAYDLGILIYEMRIIYYIIIVNYYNNCNDIDIENSLKKLKHLRENDLIDEFDYQQKKKEVLDKL